MTIGQSVPAREGEATDGLLRRAWTLICFALPFLFIVVPILAFLVQSFFYVEDGEIVRSLTLDNYVRIATDDSSIPIFLKTCRLAAEVMIVTLLIGYPIAYLLWTLGERMKYVLLLVFVVPLFMSYIIKIYAIRALLGRSGFLNQVLVFTGILDQPSTAFLFNLTAVKISLALILIPFTILPIFVSLERIPINLAYASADLGGNDWQTFRRVILPLSAPGAMTGAAFTFVLAMGDFVTPQMVGGTTGFTFGRIIQSQFGLAFNWPFGAALSVLLLLVVFIALLVAHRLGRLFAGPGV
jgi:spermidine/putrescine transport system permease protein